MAGAADFCDNNLAFGICYNTNIFVCTLIFLAKLDDFC